MQNWGQNMIAKGGIIDQRLQTIHYNKPPYSTAYPSLVNYWDSHPAYPQGNIIEGNLFYKIKNVVDGHTEWLELYNNWSTNTDPGFIDPSNPLKGFKEDALLFQRITNFPRIPFEKIGCNW